MDEFKCELKIPWTAHEVNGTADTLLYIIQGSVVCAHKFVLVEANSYYGASELGPLKYGPQPPRDVDDEAEKTRSPFEGGCRCNEEVPKDTPSDEGIFKCSECGSRLGSPHEKKCAYQ